jgi:hypothetical protein
VGVFFGAILAIHLSTISSHLNLGALYFTRDLYQRYLKPEAGQRELVWVGRIATVVLLIGSFFYGLMMEEITSWLIFALWLMMAGVWLPNILQVVWWRFNAWGYLAGWMANLGAAWLVVWVLPAMNVIPSLPDYLQFWVLMALGAAVFIPVTLMTPPEPMSHLVKYYVMTRPLGWWGPVHRLATESGIVRTGLAQGAATPSPRARPLIKRDWTPEEAEEWTREDWIAIALSPLAYALIMLGVAGSLLRLTGGYTAMALGAACALAMYWVIDPKLRAVSAEYETRQAEYVEELERFTRWESDDPFRNGEV